MQIWFRGDLVRVRGCEPTTVRWVSLHCGSPASSIPATAPALCLVLMRGICGCERPPPRNGENLPLLTPDLRMRSPSEGPGPKPTRPHPPDCFLFRQYTSAFVSDRRASRGMTQDLASKSDHNVGSANSNRWTDRRACLESLRLFSTGGEELPPPASVGPMRYDG